jgi:hypothetical protein
MANPSEEQNLSLYALQQRVQNQMQQRARAEALAGGGAVPIATGSTNAAVMLQQQQLQIQMQQQMQQLRSAMYGTFTAGVTPVGGAMRQSFGGLLMDAGGGRLLNQATFGLAKPDYSYSWGLSRAKVMQDASEELQQRLTQDVGNELIAGLIPSVIRRRTGLAFAEYRPELARAAYADLSGLRGSDIAAFGGGGDVEGVGLRLSSSAVQSSARAREDALLEINKKLGYALGGAEVDLLNEVAGTYSVNEALRAAGSGGDAQGAYNRGQAGLMKSIQELSRMLQLNVDQAKELVQVGKQHGLMLSSSAFRALGGLGNVNTSLQMSKDDIARYAMPIMAQARSMGINPVTAAAQSLGRAHGVMESYRGGYMSHDQLMRFGGDSVDEGARRWGEYQRQQSLGYASRYAGSFGVLAATDQAVGGLLNTGSRIGAALAVDPLAGLAAQQSGTVRSEMSATADLDAYVTATSAAGMSSLGRDSQRHLSANAYGGILGIGDPVLAKQEFTALDNEVNAVMRDKEVSRTEAIRLVRARKLAQRITGGDGAGAVTVEAIVKRLGKQPATFENISLAYAAAASDEYGRQQGEYAKREYSHMEDRYDYVGSGPDKVWVGRERVYHKGYLEAVGTQWDPVDLSDLLAGRDAKTLGVVSRLTREDNWDGLTVEQLESAMREPGERVYPGVTARELVGIQAYLQGITTSINATPVSTPGSDKSSAIHVIAHAPTE